MMICITGTPGVGKTEVSKKLSKLMGLKYINLNNIIKDFADGFDKKRNSLIIDENKLRGMKFEGIIDGHLSHFLDCDIIVVIRCSNQKEHIKRMKKKGWDENKIKENMEAEIMEIIPEEVREIGRKRGISVIEVDSAGKNVEEVVGEILNNLRFSRES